MSLAFNGAAGQINNLGDPPAGCEHVLTSAVNLLVADTTGFVRDDALLVLVLVTNVDDFGAYDQIDGNSCGLGCGTAPCDLNALRTLLVDSVKSARSWSLPSSSLSYPGRSNWRPRCPSSSNRSSSYRWSPHHRCGARTQAFRTGARIGRAKRTQFAWSASVTGSSIRRKHRRLTRSVPTAFAVMPDIVS